MDFNRGSYISQEDCPRLWMCAFVDMCYAVRRAHVPSVRVKQKCVWCVGGRKRKQGVRGRKKKKMKAHLPRSTANPLCRLAPLYHHCHFYLHLPSVWSIFLHISSSPFIARLFQDSCWVADTRLCPYSEHTCTCAHTKTGTALSEPNVHMTGNTLGALQFCSVELGQKMYDYMYT